MAGKMIIPADKVIINEKVGAVVIETYEEKVLKKFQEMSFDNNDYKFAQNWRSSILEINLVQIRAMSSPIIQNLINNGINTLDQILVIINHNLSNKELKTEFLKTIIELFKIEQEYSTQIFYRWEMSNKPSIKEFSPYTHYCIRSLFLWNIGTLLGLFDSRTNILDLEYLLYLPFTNVFASNDKFHKSIIQYLIVDNQRFIGGEDLKEDLNKIAKKWKVLNEEEKILWQKEFGNTPTSDTPLILELWNEFKNLNNNNSKVTNDELDFIEIKRKISINDPCPCGSGVSYIRCHGENK